MLSDLIASLTASVSPSHRALGYLDETLAMRRRSRRNRDAWKPHLEATRRFILDAAGRCGRRTKIALLGSGLLLDVPLSELAGMFDDVLLLDVVCLPETRRKINRYANVRFIEHDVTGVAEALRRRSGNSATALPRPGVDTSLYRDADLVVSLNILSQLWVVPRAFAARALPGLAPETVDEWCRSIVERHYEALRSLSCRVCLVADHAHAKRDTSGAVIGRGSTVYDLELPEPDASWTWNIVPIGKDSPHASRELLVGGWNFTGAGR